MEIKTVKKENICELADLLMRVAAEPPYFEKWKKEDAEKRRLEIFERNSEYHFFC